MPGCLGYVLFRAGQWKRAIENARKVLVNEDAVPFARAFAAVVPAMIGVLRGERRLAMPNFRRDQGAHPCFRKCTRYLSPRRPQRR